MTIIDGAYWIVLIDYIIFKITRKLNNCCISATIKFYKGSLSNKF